jgi:hypothetical protein
VVALLDGLDSRVTLYRKYFVPKWVAHHEKRDISDIRIFENGIASCFHHVSVGDDQSAPIELFLNTSINGYLCRECFL